MAELAAAEHAGVTVRFAAPGEGTPVLLLHNFTESGGVWDEAGVAEALAAAGLAPVAIDQRGHGASGKPHDPALYAEPLRAGDVVAVMDALGLERAHVWGYSMGGRNALNLARLHPDRIDKLVVGGAHPFAQDMGFYRDAVAHGLDHLIALTAQMAGPLSAATEARLRANDAAALRAAVAADRADVSAALAGFARPALFYAGSRDPIRGEVARAAALVGDGGFVEVPDANHLGALYRPGTALGAAVDFLAGD